MWREMLRDWRAPDSGASAHCAGPAVSDLEADGESDHLINYTRP
jgi:hypothetical protein